MNKSPAPTLRPIPPPSFSQADLSALSAPPAKPDGVLTLLLGVLSLVAAGLALLEGGVYFFFLLVPLALLFAVPLVQSIPSRRHAALLARCVLPQELGSEAPHLASMLELVESTETLAAAQVERLPGLLDAAEVSSGLRQDLYAAAVLLRDARLLESSAGPSELSAVSAARAAAKLHLDGIESYASALKRAASLPVTLPGAAAQAYELHSSAALSEVLPPRSLEGAQRLTFALDALSDSSDEPLEA